MEPSNITREIAARVRARLGPDATPEMVESVVQRVETLLPRTATGPGRIIIAATGPDHPDAAAGLFQMIQDLGCRVLNADRAHAGGTFSLLISCDTARCSLPADELAAALQSAGVADGLQVSINPGGGHHAGPAGTGND